MRKMILGLMALFASPAFAAAAIPGSNVIISGQITGTDTTILCNARFPCDPARSISVTPFTMDFTISPFSNPTPLSDGANQFGVGSAFPAGIYFGTVFNDQGYLTASSISFLLDGCGHFDTIGCVRRSGTATLANVVGGIPEPATWAMMLVGFGAIGASSRRRIRATRAVLAPL